MNKTKVILLASLLMAHAGVAGADAKVGTALPYAPLQKMLVGWKASPSIKKIAPDHPDLKIIQVEIQSFASTFKKPVYERLYFAEPMQIDTPALARLFLKHKFYIIAFGISPADTPVEGRLPPADHAACLRATA